MSQLDELRKLAGITPRLPSLWEARARAVYLAEGSSEEATVKDAILSAVRGKKFKSKGKWGMRTKVMVDGYKGKDTAACAIVDLERTNPHPKMAGEHLPIVLARGDNWIEVRDALVKAGELKAASEESEEVPAWSDAYPHVEEGDLSESPKKNPSAAYGGAKAGKAAMEPGAWYAFPSQGLFFKAASHTKSGSMAGVQWSVERRKATKTSITDVNVRGWTKVGEDEVAQSVRDAVEDKMGDLV